MKPEASVVEVILESNLANVETAEETARSVAARVGFDEEGEFHIEMAVHEAVINAIHHGNKEDPSKKVHIRFLVFEDGIEIHVRDEGQGFDLSTVPDPLARENILSDSGRGIFLVRKFMDEFRVEKSSAGGTEVIMAKHLTPRIQSNQGGTGREHEGNSASG
ncbi:MAG: ATP-binding protein [Acidobacteria bacterium]|nr:MAG: ATP-binding protein [Acidobacteriota bacterium]